MRSRKHSNLYPMAAAALMAAVMAVAAPFALPLGPIPVSLCTLVIYLAAYVLGGRWAAMATVLYLLLGAAGMPVFSGFSGGIGMVLGPTGGYLLSYPLLALGTGWAARRGPALRLTGMLLSTAVVYAAGTAWYCLQSGTGFQEAAVVCVLPFLPGDGAKVAVAWSVGPSVRRKLEQAGLLRKT